MDWWLEMMPIEKGVSGTAKLTYHNKSVEMALDGNNGMDPAVSDRVLLVRSRKSRIYFTRKFFDYPISLNLTTIRNLGLLRMMKIGFSYLRRVVSPIKPEQNLEDFFINRFGRELYLTFFKSYTEKVWGVACRDISAEWGVQRIKGLSITKTILHILKKLVPKRRNITQKGVETSLIEQFLYPKFGPGQMWETVADRIREMGGEILTGYQATGITTEGKRVTGVTASSPLGREERRLSADYVFSTMPVKDLVNALDAPVPADVADISRSLQYRDFITVGLLTKKLQIVEKNGRMVTDNWIYIQEPDVQVGRLQVFNNWSPYMVRNPDTAWIGLEYFCYETDKLWKMMDDELIGLAREEMARIGIVAMDDFIDGVVIRMPKTYPAYFGAYAQFDTVRAYLDGFENLFLVGRNGMHRYNNQDHSMLTAMTAVDNIVAGITDKADIWEVNAEEEYHEEK